MEVKVKDFVIKQNRSNISVYKEEDKDNLKVNNTFKKDEFKEFVTLLEDMSSKVWKSIVIKEADCMGNDFFEYYDRKLDGNGYLRLVNKENIGVNFERPVMGESKVYQFNKQKMGTFLYDCKRILEGNEVKE